MAKDIIKYNPIKIEIDVPEPNHVKSFISKRAIPKMNLIPSE
jgi:molybdopterin-binding protein